MLRDVRIDLRHVESMPDALHFLPCQSQSCQTSFKISPSTFYVSYIPLCTCPIHWKCLFSSHAQSSFIALNSTKKIRFAITQNKISPGHTKIILRHRPIYRKRFFGVHSKSGIIACNRTKKILVTITRKKIPPSIAKVVLRHCPIHWERFFGSYTKGGLITRNRTAKFASRSPEASFCKWYQGCSASSPLHRK